MRNLLAVTLLILAFCVSSCGNKNKGANFENDTIDIGDLPNTDKTLYGVIVGDGTSMNELQVLTDSGDTLNISITYAKDNGLQLGGLDAGERVAVMVKEEEGQKIATEVVNINSLLGIWLMPNPMDGSDFVGMVLKEGGIAESVNQSSLFYKSWKIFNGKLVLVADHEGGGDFEEVDTFRIKALGPDSLVIQGEEDLFEYKRSKEMPKITEPTEESL